MNLPQIKSRGSLTEKTYNTLKRAILDLDLEPGKLLYNECIQTHIQIAHIFLPKKENVFYGGETQVIF